MPLPITLRTRLRGTRVWNRACNGPRDSQHIFFQVEYGSAEGKYHDTQTRLYWVDAATGEIKRWATDFAGAIGSYGVTPDGGAVATGRWGTEVQLYAQAAASATFSKLTGWPGTYERIATATHSPRIAFIHSSLEKPNEVYIAESLATLPDARPSYFLQPAFHRAGSAQRQALSLDRR